MEREDALLDEHEKQFRPEKKDEHHSDPVFLVARGVNAWMSRGKHLEPRLEHGMVE